MKQVIYVGSNEELKGKTALSKSECTIMGELVNAGPDHVFLQFDCFNVPGMLAYGWYKFSKKDVKEI